MKYLVRRFTTKVFSTCLFGNSVHAGIYACICAYANWALAYAYVYAFHKFRECILCHGKVHISNHNYATPVVYTRSPTRFPTVLLPLSTSLSPFPQPPFEAVPSTRGGRGGGKRRGGGQDEGGVGMGRGQEAMEVGGKQGNYPLQGGGYWDWEVSQGCQRGWLVFLIFGPLTSVSQHLRQF